MWLSNILSGCRAYLAGVASTGDDHCSGRALRGDPQLSWNSGIFPRCDMGALWVFEVSSAPCDTSFGNDDLIL